MDTEVLDLMVPIHC